MAAMVVSQSNFAAADAVDQSQIPVINASGAIDGTDISGVASQIHSAAIDHGFFYISGHGIDQRLIDAAFSVSRDFFALSDAKKASVAVNSDQRGWMATGMSQLQGAKTHDLKEVFFWGADTAVDDPDVLSGKPLVAVNQWPSQVFPRLEDELRPYYAAVCDVARQVMSAVAVSLGQPANFFVDCYEKPLARGQLVYYPPSTADDDAEQRFGVAPHTDFGVLTLLLQDNSGGLQVKSKSGGWIEAPPIDGTLVCNIGDLLARWSNDRFASTVHRVINRSKGARYSVPVFFDPHTDTIVDPIDLGVSAQESLFEPVTAGEHIASRNRKSFSHFKT